MTRWPIALGVAAAFLVMTGQLAERDQRLADLERTRQCHPRQPGDLATTAWRPDGRLDCVLTTGPAGARRILTRSHAT